MAFVVSEQATREMNVWGYPGGALRDDERGDVPAGGAPRDGPPVHLRITGPLHVLDAGARGRGCSRRWPHVAFIIALDLGQVSSVSVLSASRPLFTLMLGVALSTRYWNVLNEPLDRETVGLKTLAVVMIVGGVVVLSVG